MFRDGGQSRLAEIKCFVELEAASHGMIEVFGELLVRAGHDNWQHTQEVVSIDCGANLCTTIWSHSEGGKVCVIPTSPLDL